MTDDDAPPSVAPPSPATRTDALPTTASPGDAVVASPVAGTAVSATVSPSVSKTILTLRRYLMDGGNPHGVGCTIVLRGFPQVIVGALSRTREGGLCLSCKEGKKDGKDVVRRRYFDEGDVLSFEIWSVP